MYLYTHTYIYIYGAILVQAVAHCSSYMAQHCVLNGNVFRFCTDCLSYIADALARCPMPQMTYIFMHLQVIISRKVFITWQCYRGVGVIVSSPH